MWNDKAAAVSHNANMAKRPRKPREDQYEAVRAASGWYLAAWRDRRGLTLDELASEIGSSKGAVSDLERGVGQRYNRDLIDKMSRALDVQPGFLLDVNPFTVDGQFSERASLIKKLDSRDQEEVFRLAETLGRRSGLAS